MEGVFVLHGVDHKVGSTMLTQSIGETIAGAYKEVKVLVAALHGRPGNEYCAAPGGSVEGIRAFLEGQVLSKKDLLRSCRLTENLYVLSGVENLLESRDYFPEMARYLLETLRPEFELILVDSGNEIDNGLAAGSLQLAEEKYLVLAQRESSLKYYGLIEPVYQKLNVRFDAMVLNGFDPEDPYSEEYVQDRLKAPCRQIFPVARAEGARQAEAERKTLLAYKNERYEEDVLRLANHILTKRGLPEIKKQRKGKWKSFI